MAICAVGALIRAALRVTLRALRVKGGNRLLPGALMRIVAVEAGEPAAALAKAQTLLGKPVGGEHSTRSSSRSRGLGRTDADDSGHRSCSDRPRRGPRGSSTDCVPDWPRAPIQVRDSLRNEPPFR